MNPNNLPMTVGQRRAWLALEEQDRRRKRLAALAGQPNAPVIYSGSYGWDITMGGLADVWINWTFVHGTYAVASMEVWANNSGSYFLQATVASNAVTYDFKMATDSPGDVKFKIRYVNGGTVGPFSNEYLVSVVP